MKPRRMPGVACTVAVTATKAGEEVCLSLDTTLDSSRHFRITLVDDFVDDFLLQFPARYHMNHGISTRTQ